MLTSIMSTSKSYVTHLSCGQLDTGRRGVKFEKITVKFPGKLRCRSSLLIQIQERDRTKRCGV